MSSPDSGSRPYGRRAFLLLLAGGLTSFVWAGRASNYLSPVTSAFSQMLGNLFPVGGWRIYTISGSMPIFDPSSYRLEVVGLVKKPRSFSYDELLAMPRSHHEADFHCVTGWTVDNVRWSGVRFEHLFGLVEPLPSANAMRFDSMEVPYNDSLTLPQSVLPGVMLGLTMDGQPLSRPHGSPIRVVIPEMYGYKGVKWLQRIEFVAQQPEGYWEELGYDQDAWIGRSNGYHSL
jgi:DMSO/TMAO reductase YedYZ molybdopterin-dependent catalytic subunit